MYEYSATFPFEGLLSLSLSLSTEVTPSESEYSSSSIIACHQGSDLMMGVVSVSLKTKREPKCHFLIPSFIPFQPRDDCFFLSLWHQEVKFVFSFGIWAIRLQYLLYFWLLTRTRQVVYALITFVSARYPVREFHDVTRGARD